jgi:hypothetical protein
MGDVDNLNVDMMKEILAFRLTTSGDKQMHDVEELSMGDVDDLSIVLSQTSRQGPIGCRRRRHGRRGE